MNKKNIAYLVFLFIFSFALISCGKEDPKDEGSISLNYTELSITSDSTSSAVLLATIDNLEGDIEWTSSNPDIATVTPDSNPRTARVKGVKQGVSYITVSVAGKNAVCKVTVSQGEFLNVTKTRIELAVGKTEAIQAEAHVPSITFGSSNESVATVTSSGLVTAVAEGSAIITVKAGTKTVYVTIVVEEAGVEFAEEGDVVLKLEDNPSETITLNAKGGVDIKQGTWSIDDDTVAKITVNNGEVLVEALETGVGKTTTIRYNLQGFPELTKTVTVKDVDLTLELSPLSGTLLAKDTEFRLNVTLTPTQEGERAKIIWTATPLGVVNISEDGVITRNPEYVYSEEEILISVEAKSYIDPEAKQVASILVESPTKGIKYITDLNSFNQVMTSQNSNATIYLMTDIDLGGKVYSGSIMPSDFHGHFHGNGHKISNFTAAGLFGSIYGTVENLALEGIMIGSQRGFLAFHIVAGATVRNIYINVTFKRPSTYVAGLALLGTASNVIIIAKNPDGILVDQVYGGFVQGGTGTNVFLNATGSISIGGMGIAKLTEQQLKSSSMYTAFDTNIWNIEDGKVPSLIIQNIGG